MLDRGSQNFRDPRVFWHEGDDGEGYWVMAVVEATDHEVLLYRSDDLKDWDYLSTFGPANADRGDVGMPGPLRGAGRRRPEQHPLGVEREPEPRGGRW